MIDPNPFAIAPALPGLLIAALIVGEAIVRAVVAITRKPRSDA